MLPDVSSPPLADKAGFALRLVADRLSMQRGARLLFEGLSFSLVPGDILQLTGPNGSGKSTLLRLIAGFSQAQAGSIRWEGLREDAEKDNLIHYHGHRDGLRDALSPHENLAFFAGLSGTSPALIPQALETLGITRLANLPVGVLSEGQRRRAALCRLLIAPRPLWLLDEPLAALDSAACERLGVLLSAHAKSGGMALIATHQPVPGATGQLVLGKPHPEKQDQGGAP